MSGPVLRLSDVPRPALWLGLAGLIPFYWGAASALSDPLFDLGQSVFGPRFVGQYVQLAYGTVILSFMSGVLWGFSTKATGATAALCYSLSVLPALWAFAFIGGGADRAAVFLILGFTGLLGLDWQFWRWGFTPNWWLSLRILLTSLVVFALFLGIFL